MPKRKRGAAAPTAHQTTLPLRTSSPPASAAPNGKRDSPGASPATTGTPRPDPVRAKPRAAAAADDDGSDSDAAPEAVTASAARTRTQEQHRARARAAQSVQRAEKQKRREKAARLLERKRENEEVTGKAKKKEKKKDKEKVDGKKGKKKAVDEGGSGDSGSGKKEVGRKAPDLLPQDVLDAVAEAHIEFSDSDSDEQQQQGKKKKAPAKKAPKRIRFTDDDPPADLQLSASNTTVSVLRADAQHLPPRSESRHDSVLKKNLLRGRPEMALLGAGGKGRKVVRGRMVRRPFGAAARRFV
jgi:hypothetical protein